MNAPAPIVRPMREDDVESVTAIEKRTFSDPWPKSAFREILDVPSRFNLVLELPDDSIGGYILAQIVADEIQIQNIAVIEAELRKGLGTILLRAAEEEGVRRGALSSVLDVRANNTAALSLYERFGYRMIGRRKHYYRRPVDDAMILFKRLDLSPSIIKLGE